MSKLRVTLRVDFDRNNAIGPGKIALLEKMREHGSLSQAAKALDMSYRRAWQLLNSLNQSFREPLVVTAIGGSGGGGSTLTAMGESMIATYRDFEAAMNARADKQFGPFLKNVSGGTANTRRPVSKSQQAARNPVRKSTRQ